MVPVLVKGTFSAPSFQPDLKAVLEQQLQERGLPSTPKDLLKPQEGETKPPTGEAQGYVERLAWEALACAYS
jgi:hypothetical protein